MSSYLDIAETVLRAARRPMTAKGVLNAAYSSDIVPGHLFGKTQEKTLQARLSEDILQRRSQSRFYRTKPGYFFLAEFESDPEISEKYKRRFSARRRTRDLYPQQALAIDTEFVESKHSHQVRNWSKFTAEAAACDAIKYIDLKHEDNEHLPVWTFSVVRKNNDILTYRIGRYRDDRDEFANKRTIGFPCVVSAKDQTLFSGDDLGARDCALNVLLADLDISLLAFTETESINHPEIVFAMRISGEDSKPAMLVVLEWSCPDWYEPTNHRLSLNDLSWMDASFKPNNIEDFEPWSIAALEAFQSI